MESNNVADETHKIGNQENSTKELSESRSSIKSTKSLEKRTSNTGSIKSEKDVHFANTSFKEKGSDHKSEKQDTLSQKSGTDGTPKVPHKFIANWKQACDRTRDRTRDLLKRWRTLPECEENAKSTDKIDSQEERCGWSVHVWTTWVDRFSIDASQAWEEEQEYQLTPTQSNKFSHFFTCLLDHDRDDLVSDQDFEALSEASYLKSGTSKSYKLLFPHTLLWISRGYAILLIGPRIRQNLIFCNKWNEALWKLF